MNHVKRKISEINWICVENCSLSLAYLDNVTLLPYIDVLISALYKQIITSNVFENNKIQSVQNSFR